MDIKVPTVGESIREAEVGKWHKKDGESVAKDDLLVELETDKITLELNAEVDGVLHIGTAEGKTVEIGAVIGTIEEASGGKKEGKGKAEEAPKSEKKTDEKKDRTKDGKKAAAREGTKDQGAEKEQEVPASEAKSPRPAEKSVAAEEEGKEEGGSSPSPEKEERTVRRPMSPIRRKIAERLLSVRQQTAMLTTFNEADMSRVMALRHRDGQSFAKRHGVKLGLMSFFVKACVEALREFPEVNASLDGDDILYHNFYDIGIAIGAKKGLLVPVLRDADRLHFAEIERTIADFVDRAGNNRIQLADLEGGTFTISNGGVYGSLLSTPILNPPQSAVLGMHAIQERAVVRDGEVVIRPMMNLALSYDHQIIDGRQAVGFLKRIKEYIEDLEGMLLEQ
ncbi:2-oxoglutarate dehydrogenase E2 component [Desulfuromonas soudanensis]|uniref:Dihydrolipoyllysine-residue succinyltransferase n=1 Tax=Desulfuromonas soudanensis TaxID=1603606 RepID=A0A0M4CZ21_9BACT|nr:2-oxoglutarate dehydrogenase complex dihydrolipoyllysine-residue succinyltransferase [Desulfuromonas soudanensis]ALC17866.1 2-oxoglutarate dehydrogenase E2 component [Desulfuromonas soudanensis]